MWKGMAKVKRNGFKEFYEIATLVDVQWECSYNKLYEKGEIVWELIGGLPHIDNVIWREDGKGSKNDIYDMI